MGARSYPGNPYDGHTLYDQLQQVEAITGVRPRECYADLGYRGHGVDDVMVIHRNLKRGLTDEQKAMRRRRNSIKPILGHMKSDGKLGR